MEFLYLIYQAYLALIFIVHKSVTHEIDDLGYDGRQIRKLGVDTVMKKRLMLVLLAMTLVVAACGEKADSDKKEHELALGEQQQLPNGDLQEVTASATELPAFMDDKPEDMRLIYQVAGSATEILDYMPCYCGCGESIGHGSNKNCFIDEIREDGSVVWDDHGTRCLVCLEIAVQSVKLTQDGKSLKEVREFIDATYKEGYAEPTNTPMPS